MVNAFLCNVFQMVLNDYLNVYNQIVQLIYIKTFRNFATHDKVMHWLHHICYIGKNKKCAVSLAN